MKLFLFLILFTIPLLAGPNLTYEERELEKQTEVRRKNGFADIELDNLHNSITQTLIKIKDFAEKGIDKKHAKYLGDKPIEVQEILNKDTNGKQYLAIDLASGESFADYPKIYLYDSKVYIYLAEDAKSLDKIILQFKRTNANGDAFIREMRRMINPSPKSVAKEEDLKTEGANVKADDNSDIILEYYNSNEGTVAWPDEPIQKDQPLVSNKLNDATETLPFNKQKLFIEKYKGFVRKIDKAVKKRLYILELDRMRMVSKMLEIY